MLKIVKRSSNNKYTGNVVVTQDDLNTSSKACIMKYCLDTTRDQYFYNYYLKYLGTL